MQQGYEMSVGASVIDFVISPFLQSSWLRCALEDVVADFLFVGTKIMAIQPMVPFPCAKQDYLVIVFLRLFIYSSIGCAVIVVIRIIQGR